MILEPNVKSMIAATAIKRYPNEMCGFIINGDFLEVPNIGITPEKSFEVDHALFIEHAAFAESFIHSHPDGWACPSERDMQQQVATNLPWGILACTKDGSTPITFFGDMLPKVPLKGRGFIHGVTDCYDIIRDWYKEDQGIDLKNFPRSWEWWKEEDKDLYKTGFKEAGFIRVHHDEIEEQGPQRGDVFLAKVGHHVTKLNHGGVYLGDGLGLHHLTATHPVDPSRMSAAEPIERWMKYIHEWVRYAP